MNLTLSGEPSYTCNASQFVPGHFEAIRGGSIGFSGSVTNQMHYDAEGGLDSHGPNYGRILDLES